MKRLGRLGILLVLHIAFAGCEKVEVPTVGGDESQETREENGNENNNEDGNDNENKNDTTITNMRCGTRMYPFLPSDFAMGDSVNEMLTDQSFQSNDLWVCGYVVGYVKGSSMSSVTLTAGDKETNLVLADKKDVTDVSKMMPIQLSKSTKDCLEVREQLNLSANPDNLHKRIKVHGNVEKYMGVWGMKDVDDFAFVE